MVLLLVARILSPCLVNMRMHVLYRGGRPRGRGNCQARLPRDDRLLQTSRPALPLRERRSSRSGTESSQTLRWREMDSNSWYRGTKAVDFRSVLGIAGGSAGLLNGTTRLFSLSLLHFEPLHRARLGHGLWLAGLRSGLFLGRRPAPNVWPASSLPASENLHIQDSETAARAIATAS